MKPIVENHNGQWVKEIGDGLLLTFNTVIDAVNCSIKFQDITKNIESLNLRIGIHQGEIIAQENDVLGDDVNIASRIEPFSAKGGIAISNKVNDAIIREKEFETKYIGKPKLKGVSQSVEVFCIVSHQLPKTDLSKALDFTLHRCTAHHFQHSKNILIKFLFQSSNLLKRHRHHQVTRVITGLR